MILRIPGAVTSDGREFQTTFEINVSHGAASYEEGGGVEVKLERLRIRFREAKPPPRPIDHTQDKPASSAQELFDLRAVARAARIFVDRHPELHDETGDLRWHLDGLDQKS